MKRRQDIIRTAPNNALHRTAIPLLFIAAGELWRWPDKLIEKEKTYELLEKAIRRFCIENTRNN